MMFKLGKTSPGKTLIAIVSSEQAESEIKQVVRKIPGLEASIKKTADTMRDAPTLVNGSADVVIVESDLSDPRSEAVLKGLCHYVSHDGAMMVISDDPTAAQMRMLFKTGVNDVLSLPLNETDFINSVQAAFGQTKRQPHAMKPGEVVTLMKCGGGAGATMLATNLANQFMKSAQKGKGAKGQNASVAVFDFDVQFGTVATNLNIKKRSTILDIMKAESRLDAALFADSVQSHVSGLNILSSPEEIIPLTAFDIKFFETIINFGRTMFDYTFIDMPQAWSKWTHTVLSNSDVVVPVMKPTVDHAHNAVKLLDGLRQLDIESSKTLVVVNQVGRGIAYKDRVSNISKMIKQPYVTMREDISLHKTARDRGELISNIHGNAGSKKDLNAISAKIWKQLKNNSDQNIEDMPQKNALSGQTEIGL